MPPQFRKFLGGQWPFILIVRLDRENISRGDFNSRLRLENEVIVPRGLTRSVHWILVWVLHNRDHVRPIILFQPWGVLLKRQPIKRDLHFCLALTGPNGSECTHCTIPVFLHLDIQSDLVIRSLRVHYALRHQEVFQSVDFLIAPESAEPVPSLILREVQAPSTIELLNQWYSALCHYTMITITVSTLV